LAFVGTGMPMENRRFSNSIDCSPNLDKEDVLAVQRQDGHFTVFHELT
jgi:hypothetical protein